MYLPYAFVFFKGVLLLLLQNANCLLVVLAILASLHCSEMLTLSAPPNYLWRVANQFSGRQGSSYPWWNVQTVRSDFIDIFFCGMTSSSS